MELRYCENCGKSETDGHLYADPATNRVLCMCCKFVADAKHKAETDPLIVYLACPYSHDSEDVRHARFEAANLAAGHLASLGYGVISPISQGHPIAETGLAAGDWETWAAVDKRMIDASDAVVVLNIHGLSQSVGVRAEVIHAFGQGKAFSVMTPVGSLYSFIEGDDAILHLAATLGIVPLIENEEAHG